MPPLLAPSTLSLLLGPLFATTACVRSAGDVPAIHWEAAAPGLDTSVGSLGRTERFFALRFDQLGYQLRFLSPAGGLQIPEGAPADAVAIWNGGYFEQDLRPSGLVIDQGRQVSVPSRGSGLALLGERLSLARYRNSEAAGPHESAVQLWPFLIEPGGGDGIHRDDGKRARRSAIALDDSGRGILIAVTGDKGISLLELMRLCRALGAVVALNLDGGPSTGFALLSSPTFREQSLTPVSNALMLVRRDAR